MDRTHARERTVRITTTIVVALLAMPVPGSATEVYKSIDADGNVVFSDEPPRAAASEVIKVKAPQPQRTDSVTGPIWGYGNASVAVKQGAAKRVAKRPQPREVEAAEKTPDAT